MNRNYWFELSARGFGWRPKNWKGWVVVAFWVIIFLATTRYASIGATSFWVGLRSFVKLMLLWTVLLSIIFWKKIEPPHFFHREAEEGDLSS